MYTIPTALKLMIGLAIVVCAFVDFMFFIGGGASGNRAMANIGLVVGAIGLLSCAYGLFLLTRPAFSVWQLGVLAFACLPIPLIVISSRQ